MKQQARISLRRNSDNWSNTNYNIIPSSYSRSRSRSRSSPTSSSFAPSDTNINTSTSTSTSTSSNNNPLVVVKKTRFFFTISTFFRSLLRTFSFTSSAIPSSCRWLSIPGRSLSISSPKPLGRKVTGTLFGHRKGHVTFAVQDHPKGDPALLLHLAMSTSALVREMSSGLVRIALECQRGVKTSKLFFEPVWNMYCNGRKCGYATTRASTEFDSYVLKTVQSVSVGAGVIPLAETRPGSGSEGELLYMRATFERVVGNRDSEAFYMLNPDGTGGPELSIFLLRL